MKRKQEKKTNKGFTLIELLIAMTIFGFLVFVITGILISIVQTVYTINQRSFLRNNLENMITQMTSDLEFATNVSACPTPPYPANSCIVMQVPSLSSSGVNTNTEMLYYNSSPTAPALRSIVKSVNINGSGTPIVKVLSASNVDITSATFSILNSNGLNGNVLFSVVGQVQTGINSSTTNLPLSAVIQFNSQ